MLTYGSYMAYVYPYIDIYGSFIVIYGSDWMPFLFLSHRCARHPPPSRLPPSRRDIRPPSRPPPTANIWPKQKNDQQTCIKHIWSIAPKTSRAYPERAGTAPPEFSEFLQDA